MLRQIPTLFSHTTQVIVPYNVWSHGLTGFAFYFSTNCVSRPFWYICVSSISKKCPLKAQQFWQTHSWITNEQTEKGNASKTGLAYIPGKHVYIGQIYIGYMLAYRCRADFGPISVKCIFFCSNRLSSCKLNLKNYNIISFAVKIQHVQAFWKGYFWVFVGSTSDRYWTENLSNTSLFFIVQWVHTVLFKIIRYI